MSRTYLALLHYDGRDFVGWQRQPEGRSVQSEVERVLEQLCGRRVVAHAAGRTDAGVHAVGQGVSFTVPPRWTAERLRRALNALLPRDCWVAAVSEMMPGFHARKHAVRRRYRYDVGTDEAAASPFRRPYEWALGRPLDRAALDEAASLIRGTHSFEAFAARSGPKLHYRCTVLEARWEPRDGDRGFSFHIAADRFLHHMVRFLVGTMVDIGLGRRPLADLPTLLASRDNQATSVPAPPQGLFFVAAEYPAACYAAPVEAA
ncbi:MAG TPA: tRNA pseudouridine(38-40) synthase TruA [Gemmatimonadales bacterium]|jgi:tRNA pseudouridine38-40 synthase|nr:tRNA pseudouridine(38-40) synthase TruA [Gemmatimonadales bacterium]